MTLNVIVSVIGSGEGRGGSELRRPRRDTHSNNSILKISGITVAPILRMFGEQQLHTSDTWNESERV